MEGRWGSQEAPCAFQRAFRGRSPEAAPGEKESLNCQNKKSTEVLGQSKALKSDGRQQRQQISLPCVAGTKRLLGNLKNGGKVKKYWKLPSQ